jgi:hypothetical protein
MVGWTLDVRVVLSQEVVDIVKLVSGEIPVVDRRKRPAF